MEDKPILETKEPPIETEQTPSRPEETMVNFRRNLQIEQDDLVVFGEDGQFYLIQKAEYTAHELPATLTSTAEFLVGLGAVVADVSAFEWEIPWKQLTDNCACIVLNLAAIRQISEKKDKPITFMHRADGHELRAWKQFAPPGNERPAGKHRARKHLAGKESRRTTPAEEGTGNYNQTIGPDDLVIFNEDKKFYWVKEDDYASSRELHEELRSAPELMVMLGVVVADIPRIPTAGTACFLLNLASVRRGSSHAAQLLAENIQLAKHPGLHPTLKAERKAANDTLRQKKQEDLARLEKWLDRAKREENEEKRKTGVLQLQREIEQQLRIIDTRRVPLLALKDKLQTEQPPPSEPVKGQRRIQTASARGKRVSGKRTSTTRHGPRGGKK